MDKSTNTPIGAAIIEPSKHMFMRKPKWRTEAYFDFIWPLIVIVRAHASTQLEDTFHGAIIWFPPLEL